MKVVEKFTENYGTECGNMALKTMPYGGIYLIGGVTAGIEQYLLNSDKFMESFTNKGRLQGVVSQFQVFVVDPNIEVGLLGAEEKARREMLKTK
jgi:glucokinase